MTPENEARETLQEMDQKVIEIPEEAWIETAKRAREAAEKVLKDSYVDPKDLKIPVGPIRR